MHALIIYDEGIDLYCINPNDTSAWIGMQALSDWTVIATQVPSTLP
jgi:hypothetical protein